MQIEIKCYIFSQFYNWFSGNANAKWSKDWRRCGVKFHAEETGAFIYSITHVWRPKTAAKMQPKTEKTKKSNKFRFSDQDLSKYIAEGVLLWHLKDDHKLAAFKILKTPTNKSALVSHTHIIIHPLLITHCLVWCIWLTSEKLHSAHSA